MKKLLKKNNLTKKETEELEILVNKLETMTQIQAKLFRNLKAFRSLYNQYHICDINRILREREKFINYLIQKLQNLKINERAPQGVVKSWKEILKENLHRITTISFKQKSQIVKIIQKNKINEEDKTELVSTLKKLPIEDLISLLGKNFEKHSKNYIRWGWDFYEYIKKDMLISYINKNESNYFLGKNISVETANKIIKKCLEFDIEIKNLFDYKGRTSKLKLVCKKCGHGSEEGKEWYKTGNNILKVTWKGCPKCQNRNILIKYFNLLKTRANQKGLEVISDFNDYQNSRSRIKLSCLNLDCLFGQNGDWSRVASSIMESSFHGCPKCYKPQKGTLKSKQYYYKELKTLATLKGGKIINERYTNSRKKYKFECKNGHTFKRYPYEIKKGYWCKQCFKNKKLKEMQKIARKKNGKLISTEYVNALTPLIWECNKCFLEGRPFRWSARPADIKKGNWCPKCAGKLKYSINDMKKFATSKKGYCLSSEYKNMKSPLWWKCGECGNEWLSTPTSVIHQGTWCPRCGRLGISERVCRKFFEILFNKKFPTTTSLKWLVNENGYKMHLDGYDDELRIAFEYNGIQHYIYNKHFYKTKEEFEQRIRDDRRKKELCNQNNIVLIIIPYYVSFDEMEDFIRKECKMRGIHIPETEDKIDWNDFNIATPNKLTEMQNAAKVVGIKRYGYPGKCLSNNYLGRFTPLRWECGNPSCRHQWWETPNNVINHQRWCPRCAGKRYTIKDMHILASEKLNGGKCLSEKYKGAKVHLAWECGICGNIWSASPDNIRRGKGCPKWREHKSKKKLKRI